MSHPISVELRRRAVCATPKTPHTLTGWFGYFTEPYVVVHARLPEPAGTWWWSLSDSERRLFMLFAAEDLDTYFDDIPPVAYATRAG
jgi:hypothetical protein